ncbi:MAG: hypothetical protein KKD05_03220 [Candidatus Omnitrophica bacterium]|nr:hypothetical protein [Candidatus Omnitrophota bacterium]
MTINRIISSYIIIIFVLLISGCSTVRPIKKNSYHKLYPDAQAQFAQMDKEQALKVFQEVFAKRVDFSNSSCNNSDYKPKFSISETGVAGVFKHGTNHRELVYSDLKKVVYRTWTTSEADTNASFKWENVESIGINNTKYVLYGDCWDFSLSVPWDSQDEKNKNGFGFSVFTQEERDRAIAALLWLCPKIK